LSVKVKTATRGFASRARLFELMHFTAICRRSLQSLVKHHFANHSYVPRLAAIIGRYRRKIRKIR